MIVCGECFDWAYDNLPDARNAKLVHATVHPFGGKFGDRRYPHAWIERAGRVFDWQSVEKGLGPGPLGWPRKRFYEVYQPDDVEMYSYEIAQKRPWLRHGPSPHG